MTIKAIITGATGMVGEGVLLECLHDPAVTEVLVLGRKASGYAHPKLRELLHANFEDLSAIESQLTGYDACFYCAGISAVGVSKAAYERFTYDTTLAAAQTLARLNPGMAFCYVTGAGTDGTERGRSHWARVKGRTENALRRLPFRAVYLFRPGYLHPTPGQRNVLKMYKFLSWLYPVLRRVAPRTASTLREMGRAMIAAARDGYPRPVLEVPDIVALARGNVATPA
ncbi:NAD-dependent epimerase/dehydratase family protein [Hymenobacter sp.]|uniref:NAD-dependent epimerase/dehydratase family protein n=1 Tax=Hymenobacter sp. TaxID=1898978 RepID=UPI00286D32BD|nr:NAD-dependent epimerase/dehydratase family protein [Hymenobacter sp.]